MNFTVKEVFGQKLPYEWYANEIEKFAKEKYGLNITVTLTEKCNKYISKINSEQAP